MPRVVSKNLFNFQPNGVLDDDIIAANVQDQTTRLEKLAQLDTDQSVQEYATAIREMIGPMFGCLEKHPYYINMSEACDHSQIKVPMRDGNDYEVPVLIHSPKRLAGNQKKAALIYAHGGGAVAGTAQMFQSMLSAVAEHCGVLVFNVDYRLAPETKCPKNVLDFYCAIKHVIDNAVILGVDPAKIAISGDSGGGYICFGAMVMLAQKNQSDLIKLALPSIPMISDYCFGDPAEMTKHERESALMMRKIWKMIADNFDEQRSDPLLFPAKASDELLEKMPPTIIVEMEFDMFITEATRMARRMKAAGRLLELIIMPGMNHDSAVFPDFKCHKRYGETFKVAIDQYLHN